MTDRRSVSPHAAEAAHRGTRSQMRIATAIVFVDSIGFGILTPVIPFILLQMGSGVILVTQLIAAHRLAGFICAPGIGRISDRIGRVRTIGWTILSSIAAFAGMLWMVSVLGLFVFRTLTGALTGRDAVVRALATDGVDREAHARLLGTLAGAAAVGTIVGPAITAVLSLIVADRVDLFRTVVALNIGLLAATFLALKGVRWTTSATMAGAADPLGDTPPGPGPATAIPLIGDLATVLDPPASIRAIAVPLMIAFLTVYAYGVLIAATGLLALARFGWTEIGTAWLLGTGALLVGVARMVVMPRAIARFGMIPSLATAVLIAAAALLAFGLASDPRLFAVAFVLYALAGGVAVLMPTVIVSHAAPPRQRGQFLGAAEAASALGLFASASSSGFLFAWIAPAAPYVFGAGALLCCVPLLIALERRTRRRSSDWI